MEYQGMRWFKCDFQVQTPEDAAHWFDEETRLPTPRRPLTAQVYEPDGKLIPRVPNENKIQEIARKFLRRCHELKLELIGVTDHNFSREKEPRDWFLTHLVEQNKSVAAEFGNRPIAILPGFEVDIGYHVLCLFAPAKKMLHVQRVNMILTKLGLGEDDRFSRGVPLELRNNESTVSLKNLLEVVQVQHKGLVIAAHADQNDGLFENPRNRHDYKLQKLMAVELTAAPPARYQLDILSGRNKDWARVGRAPACVRSSDAKSLKFNQQTGEPGANALGYRHTWVKLSSPSIEALRQGFCDPKTRIKLTGPMPSTLQTHPRIKSIEITGAKFLSDIFLEFSDGLNCIIGGRGSGKSTVLEYLRLALDSEFNIKAANDVAFARKQQLAIESLGDSGKVRIAFEVAPGVTDTVHYRPSAARTGVRMLEREGVVDVTAVLKQLRALFFSQGELTRMTSGTQGQAHVLSLLDSACGATLTENCRREEELKQKLVNAFQANYEKAQLEKNIATVTQELAEIERQLEARESVREVSRLNQGAAEGLLFIDKLSSLTQTDSETLTDLIQDLQKTTKLELSPYWPNPKWLKDVAAKSDQASIKLAEGLIESLQIYKTEMADILDGPAAQEFNEVANSIKRQFQLACEEKGLQPVDITKLSELLEAKREKLDARDTYQKNLTQVLEQADSLSMHLAELHKVWRDQYDIRNATALNLQSSMAQSAKIKTKYMGDDNSFTKQWQRLAPKDGRGKLGRRWEELGQDVLRTWRGRASEESPWEMLLLSSNDPILIPYLHGEMMEDLQPKLYAHLISTDVRHIWEDVRTTRISDGIDIELMDDKDRVIGSMNGTLSEGQRNTLLLNLILAKGDGPVVIDQPEDELDSSFIYKNLVEDFRRIKGRRQLIVATHNANLPVNGDAELIVALTSEQGRGDLRASGGLDHKDVVSSILDIMEGSERAFRLRSEKYYLDI